MLDAERRASADGGVVGVIVTLGGQTPLKLAHAIDPELVLGTPPDAIDLAEDRERWSALCDSIGLRQPPGGTATTPTRRGAIAREVGYPVLVRPSYVLGGRDMQIVYDDDGLKRVPDVHARHCVGRRVARARGGVTAERPVLIDRFLEDAIEVDVDALRDATARCSSAASWSTSKRRACTPATPRARSRPTLDAGVIATLDRAGRPRSPTRSGDRAVQRPVRREGRRRLRHRGEPARVADRPVRRQGDGRAGRRRRGPPARGHHARPAARRGRRAGVDAGASPGERQRGGPPVQPLPRVDTLLGPEMRSTGEVMGTGATFGVAFAKSQLAAGTRLPDEGCVFFSLADRDKPQGAELAAAFVALGFSIAATIGTAGFLRQRGVEVRRSSAKSGSARWRAPPSSCSIGCRPAGGEHALGAWRARDGALIRRACVAMQVPCLTTLAATRAAAAGVADRRAHRRRSCRSRSSTREASPGPVDERRARFACAARSSRRRGPRATTPSSPPTVTSRPSGRSW